ncbi:E3 ubiquitin-protein ligase TTC3-like [Hippocampus zosterae]|uniref:E3 ubiquitin-protein ligase TTC3-like n=1 Tax=Hippocampus zosterae TaxID=109293 RepID=UPI00223CED6D|nr:E3 ubiquitin-protein ligase TTC3-like [Hippocampus zosterae]
MAAISDLDSEDTDCVGDWVKNRTFFQFVPKLLSRHLPISINEDFDSWLKIPVHVKKEADIHMRFASFWSPILLKVDAMSVPFHWATHIGLLNAHDPTFVSLETLRKIDTIEAVLRALEAAAYLPDQLARLTSIHNSFYEQSPEALEDAVEWLEQSGKPDMRSRVQALAHQHLRHTALGFIFHQYVFYIHMMGVSVRETMMELNPMPHEDAQAASEYHKKVGNDLFQEEKYQGAAFEYTIAVRFNPGNHIAFSNRALCHTRRQNYLDAAVDAKRATLIEPSYTKGHYRYCEALFLLGEVQWAARANKEARFLCAKDRAGIKDLEQQNLKFVSKNPKGGGKGKKAKQRAAETIKKTPNSTKPEDTNNPTVVETQRPSRESDGNGRSNNHRINVGNGVCKVNKQKRAEAEDGTAGAKESPKTSKKKSTASKDNWDISLDRSQSPRFLSDALKTAHTSLLKQCYYNADTFFRQAASLADSFTSDQKKALLRRLFFLVVNHQIIGFSSLDMQLVLYGRVSALTEIGKPQEFAEARKLLEEIKSYKERGFGCLLSYARGRIYLKEKKFAAALEQFEDALQMVRNRITMGKLTWPQTTDIVRETDPDLFQEILEDSIYTCKFPPPPDGTCRYEDCLAPSKNIYITDPDFKGFVEFKCSQKCLIEYHSACWKAFKPPSFDKCEKPCPTPDCSGIIDSIKVIDATGLIKRVQAANARAESPKKVKGEAKEKPPSWVKKLKEKNHGKKEENTKTEQTAQNEASVSDRFPLPKTVTAAQTQQKAWLLYQDRVLVQVSQMMQLLRQEKALAASDVSRCLKPWLELDSARGNRLAAKMLDWKRERLQTLDQAVELLLQRRNRVWARALVQMLSNTLNINADLGRWAGRLDDADLKAAKSFVERNADRLDELDLSPLLTFAPLKEIISDHDPPGANLTSSDLTQYVKRAPPHQMRLFIWTLEEHKDVYISLNNVLDEYFVNMIDGHCSVLKKSGNQNSFPAGGKSRGRRKKKEPQVLPFFCGWENDAADERDQENPIYFPDPNEPFSIPQHLREPIAQFEEQYYGTGRARESRRILDNNPDLSVENLYDYFAQVLEEHGPLPADDPLLRGEIQNFPPVARAKIQQAGGLERFLLQCLRFSNIGGRVALAKWTRSDRPQPPRVFSSGSNLRNANPYVTFHMDELLPPTGKDPVNHPGRGKLSLNPFPSLDLSAGQVDEASETYSDTSDLSLTAADAILKKHAEVQTYRAVKDCVAVNTEPLQPYESLQGDINKKVKRIQEMGEQISKMAQDRELVDQKHRMTLASLEKDIQEISTNIKITDKEMSLFQQKLEEEVKRDQKEKKANQEVLKALKIETEKLVEERARFVCKSTQTSHLDQFGLPRSKRRSSLIMCSYDEKLSRFLDLSNQSAAEKMSLEDEIKRCRNSIAAAHRRCRSAQLSMLESSRDRRLYGLRARLADAKTLQLKLDKYAQQYPSLEASRQNMGGKVQELEQKIAALEIQYKEQVEQVKRGREVKELLGSHQADLQVSLLSSDVATLSVVLPPPPQSSAAAAQAAAAATSNVAGPAQAAGNTVLDKAVESLGTIFPEYSRSDLMTFFKDLRSSNGGSLSKMSLQDVLSAASQLILDQKEAIASGAAAAAAPPPGEPSSIWQKSRHQTPFGTDALNLEDPCAICHEEMSPPHCLVLECRHAFHEKCIASWLKDSNTCPNCRKQTLFKDFPVLPGRRRQAP